jgi:DNA adenine methylase
MWNPFKSKPRVHRIKSTQNKASSSFECKVDGKYCFKGNDKPLKPIIARAGGKTQLVPKILKKAPSHKTYVEPFVGGGAVFLKKPLAERNVINDKDKDVMKVYKGMKNSSTINKCNNRPSKKKFNKIKSKSNKSMCDILYLNKNSFGSGGTAYASDKHPERFKNQKNLGIIYQKSHKDDYKEKLKKTTVLNQDYKKVMKRYDGKNTFFYLDPPYVGSEKVYKEQGVTPEDVCKIAKSVDGKVLISYNDHPRVRKACRGMRFNKVNTRYTLGAKSNNTKAKEVLISNYKK